jgi:hypothetical protein
VPRPVVGLLAAALLPATATAAPVPKDQKVKYYAATRVGDRREYRAGGVVTHITRHELAKAEELLH